MLGCRYGDHDPGCSNITIHECYEPSTESECCSTCGLYSVEDDYGYGKNFGTGADTVLGLFWIIFSVETYVVDTH